MDSVTLHLIRVVVTHSIDSGFNPTSKLGERLGLIC
jgi:hypothetical protein